MSLNNIKNFVAVNDRIATAGQPTEEQLRDVADAKFQAVVNLGLRDPKYCLPDEAALATSLGMQYCHIPVRFQSPTVDDFDAFVATMDNHSTERVLVHCAANYRVSAFMAVYGEMRLGWTRDQADTHIRLVWSPNETWRNFLETIRTRAGL